MEVRFPINLLIIDDNEIDRLYYVQQLLKKGEGFF